MPDDATKRCTKCGEVKPLSEFARQSKRPDGRKSECRACQRRYYLANRDRVKARSAEWYRENHERAVEQHREYYAANRETSLKSRARRYRANLADEQETQRKYRSELRVAVFGHYGNSCACCGATKRLSIDHIGGDGGDHREELFGRRNGGGTQFWRWLVKNGFPPGFQTLCLSCNQSKGRGDHCRLNHST